MLPALSEKTSDVIELEAADGARVSAYRATPLTQPRAGLVLVQEIFGVNRHIRSVVDRFASHGYQVIAPALFDRVERGVELGYDTERMTQGRSLVGKLGPDSPLLDISAARNKLAGAGKVGVVGFCWGGTLAFLSAIKVPGLSAVVAYYGSAIAKHVEHRVHVPVLLHFGEKDASIPASDVEHIRHKCPEATVFTYPSGHGFNCDECSSYDSESATVAFHRTLTFLEQHLR